MLKWAGASSMFKKGSHSLLPRYINIPGQPNEFDCTVFVMKWMELIDPTILAGCCNDNKKYNIEQWTEEEDRDQDNLEQGKFVESKINKGSTRYASDEARYCSSKSIRSDINS
ncbi:hypothetical protein PIB30_093871 [Stylosanthes scabra]|uniref:Ubiquitin-like protease family profile domain-containing protein n=1 Tax=Stylosanthes scabra TaxID=79078 RepID=A0ABU6XX11_9FABA|nr:hypothetical protein [Stylosanthes scabra]